MDTLRYLATKLSRVSAAPPTHLWLLDADTLRAIVLHVCGAPPQQLHSLAAIAQTCRQFRSIVEQDQLLWKTICCEGRPLCAAMPGVTDWRALYRLLHHPPSQLKLADQISPLSRSSDADFSLDDISLLIEIEPTNDYERARVRGARSDALHPLHARARIISDELDE